MVGTGMEEIGIREQFFLIPHHLGHGFGNREQAVVACVLRQFLRPRFDYVIARIKLFVDGMAKTHDEGFAFEHFQSAFHCIFWVLEFADHGHGRFIRAAMQGAA